MRLRALTTLHNDALGKHRSVLHHLNVVLMILLTVRAELDC